jgi:hypothetical protein
VQGLNRRLRKARWSTRARIADHRLYLPLARVRHHRAAIAPDSEVVIDGFTRTAGTFAVVAFQLAQPRPVRVAHHLHAASHLIAAARRGIPAILVTREPDATALSCVVREPYVSLPQALNAYARFHERLMPYRRRLVVADFAEVTSDFGAVIERMNHMFGTSYARFEHSPENVERVFAVVEARAGHPPWGRTVGAFLSGYGTFAQMQAAAAASASNGHPGLAVPELMVQRPSEPKELRKAALRHRLEHPSLRPARERARRVYERLIRETTSPARDSAASRAV